MKPLERVQDGTTSESTGASGTDPAHEVGRDGRSLLQARMSVHGAVLLAFYALYWPVFYLIWSRDPRVGPELALAQFFQPASFLLGLSHLSLCLSCRWGSRTVRQLVAIDLGSMLMVGLCFAALVRNHPCREVAVLEGCLAFMSVLAIRALLVPSSKLRSVLAGTLMVASLLVMIALDPQRFTGLSIAFSSLVSVFVNWSLVAIGFSAFASSVLYGLRREVRQAQRFGQYTLLEKLGEGGMGVVYRAQHAMLRRPTALKLLHATESARSLVRFEREVQLMAELTHPNSVTVHDYGRTSDGVLYYTMEYLDGLDLQALVDISGPQPPARVIHLLLQACGALGEAHARGLIHRDVKPANVFVCRRHGVADMVKMLDFGVVKQQQAERDSMVTLEHALIGTPRYMSPEAITTPSTIDARSDLYSLGAVGYLLLAGEPVFGGTLVEVCAHHLHTAPVPPSQRGVTVPEDLEAVVLKCLQKDPALRYPSADALAEALRACAEAAAWPSARAQEWWQRHAPVIDARRENEPVSGLGLQQTIAIDGADRTGERRLLETVADERRAN